MIKKTFNILSPLLQRFAKYYFSKPRPFNYKGIKGTVLPDVFYPIFTISTKLLMDFIEPLALEEKSFLELGCGTGMISTLAAKKGAITTATDINPAAIENVKLNAKNNEVVVSAILSDLFVSVPPQIFDFIIINPPYYPQNPKTAAEQAWFCGEDFEYFIKLFKELGGYFNSSSKVFMILSEDCEIEQIKGIAKKKQLNIELVFQTKRQGEWNYIFEIAKI